VPYLVCCQPHSRRRSWPPLAHRGGSSPLTGLPLPWLRYGLQERADSLRRRAEIDKRCLLTYTAWDAGASLRKLGQLVNELAVAFYRDEGRRVKVRCCSRVFSFCFRTRCLSPVGA
jgi:hypothetical protein